MIKTEKDILKCSLGLYKVYWKSGGSSLASIGQMYNGDRWIAPCNWTADGQENENPTVKIKKIIEDIDFLILISDRV